MGPFNGYSSLTCQSWAKVECCKFISGLSITTKMPNLHPLKGHCIEFKYYADGIHSGLTQPGNNS